MMIKFTLNFLNFYNMNLELTNLIFDMFMYFIILFMIIIMYLIFMFSMNKFNNKSIMENQNIEFFWTFTPSLLILLLSFLSIKFIFKNNEFKNNLLNIKITSYQWFWTYEYMNFNIKFNSYIKFNKMFNLFNIETNNKLILPMFFQIQLLISSFDVIHSWFIPNLNIKLDSIPNQLNSSNMIILKPGILMGQCSEICGMNHSYMPIMMEIISIKNFMNWLKN